MTDPQRTPVRSIYARNTKVYKICQPHRAIFSVLYKISQPNFAILLILNMSFLAVVIDSLFFTHIKK